MCNNAPKILFIAFGSTGDLIPMKNAANVSKTMGYTPVFIV